MDGVGARHINKSFSCLSCQRRSMIAKQTSPPSPSRAIGGFLQQERLQRRSTILSSLSSLLTKTLNMARSWLAPAIFPKTTCLAHSPPIDTVRPDRIMQGELTRGRTQKGLGATMGGGDDLLGVRKRGLSTQLSLVPSRRLPWTKQR
jgi:hypothetical protein